jgi:hypothetical protein
MKPKIHPVWRAVLLAFPLFFGVLTFALSARAENVIYSTDFEFASGYDPERTLIGQDGWVGYGSGGNGLVSDFFEGLGQHAFIGYTPPEQNTNDFLSVYRPVNLAPIPTTSPIVRFSVIMQIADSSAGKGPWDDFRWSVYNTNGVRLFSLDFDNSSLMVSYLLDDNASFVSTNTKFDNQGGYSLEIAMNFARNLWTATLNDQVVVHAKPITTAGSALNLGDVDAVWSIRDPKNPGDNFMVFDDYTITADSASSIPPRLETVGMVRGGAYTARFYGEPGLTYRLEVSEDFRQWQPLSGTTLKAPADGILEFQDHDAPLHGHRFYRVRQAGQ